ncbi:LysM peptidoglycan-binding domain-containing protein [Paludisphaera rhizosphaerae]|uniref:LysM peptidoglycan-binding domain-containing protein n=1 Tax=Paludisphaera rhizosphaerae TaxID=2711216 RepID=UPI0013EDB073|nr:LysM peptidoglycan-binding domain-containing protein [Paludisphaera rhizosphaerae]
MVEPGTHPDPDEPQELIHDEDAAEVLPSEEVAEAVETVAEALEEDPTSPKAIARILGAIGPIASKAWGGTTAAASQVGGLARAYPRASIASGLSALVLCGVFSLRSGKAPLPVEIEPPDAAASQASADPSPKGAEADPKKDSGPTPPAAESVAEGPAPAPTPVGASPAPATLEPTPQPAEVKLAGGDPAMPELPSMIDAKAGEAVAPAPAPAVEPAVEPGASLLLASAKPIEEPPAPAPDPTPAAEPELPPAGPAPAPAPGPDPTPTTEPELPPAMPAPAAAPAPEAADSEKAPAPAFPAGPEPKAPAVEPEAPAPAPPAEASPKPQKSDVPASQPSTPPAEPAFTPPAEPVQPSAPPAAFPALGAIAGAAAAEAAPGPNMPSPTPEPTAPSSVSPPTAEPKTDWLPLKHNGGPVKLDAEEMDSRDGVDPITGESSDPLRDARRAANEEPIRFVPVETRPAAAVGAAAGAAGATAAAVTSRASSRAAAASDEGKMDTVLHKVQAGENFWTISRTHYASGRYYRALGKANADQFQRLEDLYVGAVIRIPPPEDLDPAYIDPPGGRSSRNRDPAETAAAPAKAPRTAAAGVPVRRGKLEGELNLPVSDPSTERTADTGERRRASSREDFDEPAATSRRAASPPVHKVRARETLRTIARDRLGDSRRAREILDLNRDVIDDPARLPVGQVLNLPDDAE